jgi:hypothetical protein
MSLLCELPSFLFLFVFKLLKPFTFFLFLQINRMVALIKQVYGVAEFNKHNGNIQWDVVADRCSYPKTPAQGVNECGFYALRICATYGGDKIADNIKNQDVSVVLCFSRCIALCLFFTVFLMFFFCIPDCLPAAR